MSQLQLGFSTGALSKPIPDSEPDSELRRLAIIGKLCKTVELGWVKGFPLAFDRITRETLEGFDYVSVHAPAFPYAKDAPSQEIFDKITRLQRIRSLDLVVFHPDTIKDLSVFENLPFKVGFENMDNRKSVYKTLDDMLRLLSLNKGWTMVLDINHIYTNDPTLKLAEKFFQRFRNKISQIHLSGYVQGHDPLFITRQRALVAAIQDFSVPIIIESLLSEENIGRELNYVLSTTRIVEEQRADERLALRG